MNIIYDSTIFDLQAYGGVSRYFSEIIKRISKYSDINVALCKGLNILPKRFQEFNGVLTDIKLGFSKNKYDIYHPTYYSNSVKKRQTIKTVITVYDMIHEIYLYKFDSCKKDIEIKKRSILNADHIICISNNTKSDLQKIYNIPENRISVVYLGVSFREESLQSKMFHEPKRPYILYVGMRWYHYKNFNILLRAFHSLGLKKYFDMVCFGGGKFSHEEMSEFKILGLEDCIKYAEGADELLQYYYKNAEVFVYPSLYEGFGLPVLEAMANNCLVIASNGGSIPEIAGGSALLFSPLDVNELCSCIKKAIGDKNIREGYIKKAKENVKNFSWDITAEKTYDVYKKILND